MSEPWPLRGLAVAFLRCQPTLPAHQVFALPWWQSAVPQDVPLPLSFSLLLPFLLLALLTVALCETCTCFLPLRPLVLGGGLCGPGALAAGSGLLWEAWSQPGTSLSVSRSSRSFRGPALHPAFSTPPLHPTDCPACGPPWGTGGEADGSSVAGRVTQHQAVQPGPSVLPL